MTKTEKGWEIGTKMGEIGLAYLCLYQFADYLCFCSLLTTSVAINFRQKPINPF